MIITDVRDILARHKTKVWKQRNLSDIKGVVFHQALCDSTLEQVNKYHISNNNHISVSGCPRICYAVWIDKEGEAFLCNNLEDITWSQGGMSRPFPKWQANTNYVGVCFQGDFSGAEHIGNDVPSIKQLQTGVEVWQWLFNMLHLSQLDLFGHYHFGKPACPGSDIMKLIENTRETGLQELLPKSNIEWQQLLKTLGYNLGTSGLNKDGVDGDWGGLSRQALINFQKDCGVVMSAIQDTVTQQMLAWEVLRVTKSEIKPYRNK